MKQILALDGNSASNGWVDKEPEGQRIRIQECDRNRGFSKAEMLGQAEMPMDLLLLPLLPVAMTVA